jgi:hypothetical protein
MLLFSFRNDKFIPKISEKFTKIITFIPGPNPTTLNLQLQRQRSSRLERFYGRYGK